MPSQSLIRANVDLVAPVGSGAIKSALTVRAGNDADGYKKIQCYLEDDGVLSVPRSFGIKYARKHGIDLFDNTSTGHPIGLDIVNPPRPHQVHFIDQMYQSCLSSYAFKAKAHTGAGKTYCALQVISKLGCTAVVVVDQQFLMDQWVEAIQEHCGIPDSELDEVVGICQGSRCDYEGKEIVIAMVQSLYSKTYPEEFYSYFGCAVFDELHTVGAEQFSKSLSLFPARYRFGVSATPNRGDAFQKVLDFHLGSVDVTLEKKHRKSQVRYILHDGVYSWYANSSPKAGRFISEIAQDGKRNLLLAHSIKSLYNTGRRLLVIGERIWQLKALRDLCYYLGIPEEDMGLCTGKYLQWEWVKDPTPPRRPPFMHKGAEYTPVKFDCIEHRNPRVNLEEAKTKKIIFATYSLFSKGVDVPTLDAGIDVTPRSKAEQVHGRILREVDGKFTPIWVTVRDFNSYRAELQFSKRVEDYLKSNAEVSLWNPSKGIQRKDARKLIREARSRYQRLKSERIVIGADGNYTIGMKRTVERFSKENG